MGLRLCILVSLLATAACGDITVSEPAKGPGVACAKTAQCQAGLQCVANTCIDPAKGGQESDCTKTEDCQFSLQCMNGKCTDPSVSNPNCTPTFVDKINSQSVKKGQEVFQTCYCEGATGDATFDTCVGNNLPPALSSNKTCNACFLDYYDCLREACPACTLDQSPTCPDFWTDPCSECAEKTSCQDDLYQCTGGVDWIPGG